jgi:hypothetical protein
MNIPVTEPVYISAYWPQTDPAEAARIMQRLETAGYQVGGAD